MGRMRRFCVGIFCPPPPPPLLPLFPSSCDVILLPSSLRLSDPLPFSWLQRGPRFLRQVQPRTFFFCFFVVLLRFPTNFFILVSRSFLFLFPWLGSCQELVEMSKDKRKHSVLPSLRQERGCVILNFFFFSFPCRMSLVAEYE